MLIGAGCASHQPPPQATSTVSNPAYQVDLLFTDPNGTSIYRFYDQDDWRYYAVGPNGAQMLPTTKIVTETEVETVTVDSDSGGGHHGGHHK